MTLPLKIWRGLMTVSEPIRARHLRRRVAIGKEQAERLCERYGEATAARPDGRLLWVHAASNGEALASLPLIDTLCAETPELRVLVTTFTVTGADLIAKQAPHVIHQFKPSEDPKAVARFLDHWRPDLALFVESEFWPNLIAETAKRGTIMAQVNGHLSSGSARGWRMARRSFRELMQMLATRLVKSETIKARMVALGMPADSIHVTGDLKASRPLQRPNAETLARFEDELGDRPVFLAASTHPGEEEAVLTAHETVAARVPNLLTIIAPRHERRGDDIEKLIRERGLTVARRSKGQTSLGASIYLADTTGEMPLWYAVSPITFVGAGWGESGGHNPLEAAQLDSAVLSGPRVYASQAAYDRLNSAGAVRFVEDAEDLSNTLNELTDETGHPTDVALNMAQAAELAAAPDPAPLNRTMAHLRPLVEKAFR